MRGLRCHFDYHQFHEFIMSEDQNEFRLGGNFGFGFKLYKNYRNEYRFGQYPENEKAESLQWIYQTNLKLVELIAYLSSQEAKQK